MRVSILVSLLGVCSILTGCLQSTPQQTIAQRQSIIVASVFERAGKQFDQCTAPAFANVSSWMIGGDLDPKSSEKKSNKAFLNPEQESSFLLLRQAHKKCGLELEKSLRNVSSAHFSARKSYQQKVDQLGEQLLRKELSIGEYNTNRLAIFGDYKSAFTSASKRMDRAFNAFHEREINQRQQGKKINPADFDMIARERDGIQIFEDARVTNSRDAWEAYIADYPNSSRISEAKERLEWLNVVDVATEKALLEFKLNYPSSIFEDEIIERGELLLADRNSLSELDAFSKSWPELANKIDAKKVELEISMMLETAKTTGTAIKLYQFGLKKQAAGDLDGASKAYNTVVEQLPDGDFVVESLEKLLEIKATKDQIARERMEKVQRLVDEAKRLAEKDRLEKAAKEAARAAEARKREAERKERQERWDRERSQREEEHNKIMEYHKICDRELRALEKRCKANDVNCLNRAREDFGICLKKYDLL